MAGSGWRLLAADFMMSLMWVWSSVLNKILVHIILGYGAHELKGEIIRYAVSILSMFIFAFMAKATKGGAYNPLTLLSAAISGDFSNFLFTLGARIPAQVVGSVYGVRLILDIFPGIGRGPRLNVDIAKGALTEEHITKEHLIVYWLAPLEATLVATWVFGILARPKKDDPQSKSGKLN
ncbi:probable aquaporin sip2-1 [Phtheirospermum japonicum]|uniref:Probable aquaporin sip2-1 n=1 Tax=Phtheirospermum japonicum TaxID=374723 RepID=A0A830B9K8_9LAMI|nr:probable aquaporin sip2-1 [Phtheirospermum japonicum]